MTFVRPIDRVLSIDNLKRCAESLNNHFFTPGALRFFNSRIGQNLYSVSDSVGYFVTSERFEEEPRRYTVRRFDFVRTTGDDGFERERLEINAHGGHMAYDSAAQANKAAREFAADEKATGTIPEQD